MEGADLQMGLEPNEEAVLPRERVRVRGHAGGAGVGCWEAIWRPVTQGSLG